MMRYRSLFIVLLALTATSAFAQESVYSIIGLGDRIITTNPRVEAIGGSGAALIDERAVSDINPALWSWLGRTRVDARLQYATNKSVLAGDESLLHSVRLGGFTFGSPMWDTYKLAASLGFLPVTQSNYRMQRTDSVGTTTYEQSGGISEIYLGVSFKPTDMLSLGIRYDALLGKITAKSLVTSGSYYAADGTFERAYSSHGSRLTLGAAVTLDSLIPALRGVVIGASYSTASDMDMTRRTFVRPSNASLDTTIEDKGYSKLPSVLTLGIAARFGDRYRIEADYSAQDLSASTLFSFTSPIVPDARLGAGSRLSVGIERLASMGDDARGKDFGERIGLRFGAAFAKLPYTPLLNESVNEISVSGGLNIPMNLESFFDLSLTLGERSSAASLPKEQFIRIGTSISLSEKWFEPIRKDED